MARTLVGLSQPLEMVKRLIGSSSPSLRKDPRPTTLHRQGAMCVVLPGGEYESWMKREVLLFRISHDS